MKQIRNVTIIGLGLIGGSLGLAIKKACRGVLVTGFARKSRVLKKALKIKAIDKGTSNLVKSVEPADLVIIATTIKSIVPIVNRIRHHIKADTIVLDVGSTKKNIVTRASKLLPHNFIGGHPIAGAEVTGIDNARSELFINKTFVLTPVKTTDTAKLRRIKIFLGRLKMRLVALAPEMHDYIVAGVSGVPYFIAGALVHIISQIKTKRKHLVNLIGSGFRDTTRLALSNPRWGIDIADTNTKHLSAMLMKVITNLQSVKRHIDRNSKKKLTAWLNKGRRILSKVRTGK